MNHKQKLKLARKMITPEEIRKKVSVFSSGAWSKRSESIKKRLEEKMRT